MRERVLRHIFPTLWNCPACGKQSHTKGTTSRGGSLQFRTCLGCGERYKVPAIAVELALDPGPGGVQGPSVVRVL